MKLLVSQKDLLYDIIEHCGFSPSQFKFTELFGWGHGDETRLVFSNSEFYFSISGNSSRYNVEFSPGKHRYVSNNVFHSWNETYSEFTQWLNYLQLEITSPNKWERLEKEMNELRIQFSNEEDKFTIEEYNELAKNMEQIKTGMLSLQLPVDQIKIINDKLDHLLSLSATLNKFDWKGLFIGTIISIIIQLEVNQTNASLIWELIKSVFKSYLLP